MFIHGYIQQHVITIRRTSLQHNQTITCRPNNNNNI